MTKATSTAEIQNEKQPGLVIYCATESLSHTRT